MLRALALGAPLVVVAALAAGVLRLACATTALEHALSLGLGSIALLGGAMALALPVSLAIVSRERRALRPFFACWAAVPPLVSGLVVGWTLGAMHLRCGWLAALAACTLAIVPRLVVEISASLHGRPATLVDAALALGAKRSAAVRLALSGDETLWRSTTSTVIGAAGDGVAALVAVLLIGGQLPGTAELTLLKAGGDAHLAHPELGACALVVFALGLLPVLRGLPRWRRAPAEGSANVAVPRTEGART
jgi:hypothetical protein